MKINEEDTWKIPLGPQLIYYLWLFLIFIYTEYGAWKVIIIILVMTITKRYYIKQCKEIGVTPTIPYLLVAFFVVAGYFGWYIFYRVKKYNLKTKK